MADFGSFKSKLNKQNIPTELSEPDVWISTGNYALNHTMARSFDVGIPNRRTTMLVGSSGSGKSFLAGNAAKNAQEKDYFIVYIDTEDAIDERYLTRIGVNMEEDAFMPIRISTIEECSKVISNLFQDTNPDDKVCVILDSLTMLETEQEFEKFQDKGELQNDQGRTAKMYKSLVKNVNAKIGSRDMFFIYTGHTYKNQEMFTSGKFNVSGGEAQIYIPSISVMLDKLPMKEAEEGKKGQKKVSTGFRMKTEIYKSRFGMLGDSCELSIPYNTGIDPYDGLLPRLVKEGYIAKNGAWYVYTDPDGNEKKFQESKSMDYLPEIMANIK